MVDVPAVTITDAGTVAAEVSELERVTVVFAKTLPVKATVPVEGDPFTTAVGFMVTEFRVTPVEVTVSAEAKAEV